MRRVIIGFAGLLIVSFGCGPAAAYFHAEGNSSSWHAQGSRGGSASGGDGSWSASGAHGGTASGGGGSWHANGAYGGSASGGGGSWQAHGAYGGTASGGYDHYYGGSYSTYHPPTVVNSYGGGCYGCGGWAAAGVAAGAAIGAAGAAAASQNAYAAGYAAGSGYAVGAIYPVLPGGCEYRPVIGAYDCAGTWFKAAYGANGVYYRVVPGP